METIPCPKCGYKATQVINAEAKVRKGWYCPRCKHFERAIARERKIEND